MGLPINKHLTTLGFILASSSALFLVLARPDNLKTNNQAATKAQTGIASPVVTPPDVSNSSEQINTNFPIELGTNEPTSNTPPPLTTPETSPVSQNESSPPPTEVSERVDYALDPNDESKEIGTCVVTWSDGSTTSRFVGKRPVQTSHGVVVQFEC